MKFITQIGVILKQLPTLMSALPDTPQSAVLHVDGIPSFMETPQTEVSPAAGLAG